MARLLHPTASAPVEETPMQKSTAPNASFDADAPGGAADASPPVVGDADAVEKTTYVVGKGTDDRATRLDPAADNDRDGRVENETGRAPSAPRGTTGGGAA
jgi:hypothetical protein